MKKARKETHPYGLFDITPNEIYVAVATDPKRRWAESRQVP